jgi:hypothetical protein
LFLLLLLPAGTTTVATDPKLDAVAPVSHRVARVDGRVKPAWPACGVTVGTDTDAGNVAEVLSVADVEARVLECDNGDECGFSHCTVS